MANLLAEADEKLSRLEHEIQQTFDALPECQDIEQLNEKLGILDSFTQQLTQFAHELAGLLETLDNTTLPAAQLILQRLKSLLEANLEQAKNQREQAKLGVLSLRQTSAGAAAYQAVKKQR